MFADLAVASLAALGCSARPPEESRETWVEKSTETDNYQSQSKIFAE